MRGTPSTWARRSSDASRGASICLRVKNPVVHSSVLRTVHGPSGCAIVGRIIREGRRGRQAGARAAIRARDSGEEEVGGGGGVDQFGAGGGDGDDDLEADAEAAGQVDAGLDAEDH